jgi:hypothetical protein
VTSGYSGTPLPKKLGIKEGHAVAFLGSPPGFESTLGDLPPGARVKTQARGPLDVIVLFVTRRIDLQRRFSRLARTLDPAGGLWIAWPKKSSGLATDLTFEAVQSLGLDEGLVDNKVCAIDETWSGLRFVYRKADRPRARRE